MQQKLFDQYAKKCKWTFQTFHMNGNVYLVDALWDFAKSKPIEQIDIRQWEIGQLGPCWSNSRGETVLPSEGQYLPEHAERIDKADLNFPVLLAVGDQGGTSDIVDGLHRMIKWKRQGAESVPAVVLTYKEMEPYRLNKEQIEVTGGIPPKMAKLKHYYHGSPYKLEVLKPENLHGDPDYGDVVFASPSKSFALPYAGAKWGDRDLEQSTYNGVITLREMRPNAFQDIFGDKKGYVYTVPGDTFDKSKRDTPWEVTSKVQVLPTQAEEIPNVLKALQDDPNVKLFKYDLHAPETYKAVKRTVTRCLNYPFNDRMEYLKWRFENAPIEIVEMYMKELKQQEKKAYSKRQNRIAEIGKERADRVMKLLALPENQDIVIFDKMREYCRAAKMALEWIKEKAPYNNMWAILKSSCDRTADHILEYPDLFSDDIVSAIDKASTLSYSYLRTPKDIRSLDEQIHLWKAAEDLVEKEYKEKEKRLKYNSCKNAALT